VLGGERGKGRRGCGKSIKKAGTGPGGKIYIHWLKKHTFFTNMCIYKNDSRFN
jgi:hypothetical protein